MVSISVYRGNSFPSDISLECPVTLNEIFDPTPPLGIPEDGNRKELPNQRINVCLYSEVQDWKGLEAALAQDGLEVRAQDDMRICVFGYASREDCNYYREIRQTVARYRRGSKSFSM